MCTTILRSRDAHGVVEFAQYRRRLAAPDNYRLVYHVEPPSIGLRKKRHTHARPSARWPANTHAPSVAIGSRPTGGVFVIFFFFPKKYKEKLIINYIINVLERRQTKIRLCAIAYDSITLTNLTVILIGSAILYGFRRS